MKFKRLKDLREDHIKYQKDIAKLQWQKTYILTIKI